MVFILSDSEGDFLSVFNGDLVFFLADELKTANSSSKTRFIICFDVLSGERVDLLRFWES